MLELFEDGADKREDVVSKGGRKVAKPVEKVFLNKGLYNVIVIEEFLPDLLPKRIYKEREKVGDKLAEGHSAGDACAEADLQSPALLEEVDQAVVRLLKFALFESGSRDFLPSCTVGSHKVLPALETKLSFLGFPKSFMSA